MKHAQVQSTFPAFLVPRGYHGPCVALPNPHLLIRVDPKIGQQDAPDADLTGPDLFDEVAARGQIRAQRGDGEPDVVAPVGLEDKVAQRRPAR